MAITVPKLLNRVMDDQYWTPIGTFTFIHVCTDTSRLFLKCGFGETGLPKRQLKVL
jgi:hypothetical protein